jgi:hypothetical protein
MAHELDDPTQSLLGGVLVLRDNAWDDLTIDGMQGEWRRLTAQGTRGFCSVSAGRHRVTTEVGKNLVVFDLVLYPGETLVRRLDQDSLNFVLDDPETEERYMQLAHGGRFGAMSGALVDYARVCLAAKKSPPSLLPDEVLRSVAQVFVDCAAEVTAGADLDDVAPKAYRAGIELVGHAMLYSQIQRLVGLFSTTATQHAMRGNYKLGADVTMLGLAVLPGEPWLLDLLANLYSDGGLPRAGVTCSEEALRRAHVFPEKLQAQMRATYEEVSAAASAAKEN